MQGAQRIGMEVWAVGGKQAVRVDGELTVSCETTRKDQYVRWLARCDVAGVSVANWLAGHGWAVPYRDRKCEEVRALSKEAEAQNAGIWGGEFVMPWEWRAAH